MVITLHLFLEHLYSTEESAAAYRSAPQSVTEQLVSGVTGSVVKGLMRYLSILLHYP